MADNRQWDPVGCLLSMSRAHTHSRQRLKEQCAEASYGAAPTQQHAMDEDPKKKTTHLTHAHTQFNRKRI